MEQRHFVHCQTAAPRHQEEIFLQTFDGGKLTPWDLQHLSNCDIVGNIFKLPIAATVTSGAISYQSAHAPDRSC
jgi:hypothetical protein